MIRLLRLRKERESAGMKYILMMMMWMIGFGYVQLARSDELNQPPVQIPAQAMIPPAQAALLQNEIRQDFSNHLFDRIIPKIAERLKSEPMSAATQKILIRTVYRQMAVQLGMYGIELDEKEFTKKMSKVLTWTSQYSLFPSAITFGMMARLQMGVGGSVGLQFNYYFNEGEFHYSSYNIYGIQAGMAEQMKLQFYASLCFGTCFGGDGSGYYFGVDGGASAGVGAGFFIEGGIDFTDMMMLPYTGINGAIQSLYDAKALYVGFDVDVGVGAGISGNVFYYDQVQEKTLFRDKNKSPTHSPQRQH